jgi:hypothetical protein
MLEQELNGSDLAQRLNRMFAFNSDQLSERPLFEASTVVFGANFKIGMTRLPRADTAPQNGRRAG